MAPGHILNHWPPWPILNPTNPQANALILGLGCHLAFKEPLPPLTLSSALGPPPLIRGFWGLNAIFWPFRPPTASMVRGLWPIVCMPWDQLGPFWPNSNEAKRGHGGKSSGPTLAWFWPKLPKTPKPSNWSKKPRHSIWPYPSRLKPRPL
ncbi:hypothetical protein O181_044349 [Austropuccinia psidii MF-1]|uniref:Uncharacterized protein n=1 Tax=Austropuccinia psidii MF-1 TaxID=1389203 RepID=A0A9Q3DJV3_9BASI|nr:hypothetical protein [Austropuccinia psidii MF-1]